MTKEELAQKIYEAIGPKENVIDLTNCMTRVRVQLHKEPEEATLKSIEGVLGVNHAGTELQIILGPGKAQAIRILLEGLLENSSSNKNLAEEKQTEAKSLRSLAQNARVGDGAELHQAIKEKNATPFKLFLKKIANIFMPIIPGFIGCGLLKGLANLLVNINPALSDFALVQIMNLAGNATLFGLCLFVGVNTAKEFGGTPIIGGVMAAILTQPELADINFLGQNFVPGRGGIIAVLLIAVFASYLEKFLHKIIPDALDLFLTPFLTISFSSLVALLICQPLGGFLAEGLGKFASLAVLSGGAFTGFIMGGTFLPIVMFGIHQGLTPVHVQLISSLGVTILLPIFAMAGAGQVGAAFAVYLKTKNAVLKNTVASALPIGIMGIGEPLIYGVTLPLGKPFMGACIGGALGGAVQAYFVTGASIIGLSGLPLATCIDKPLFYLIGVLTAYAGGFLATWLMGFDDPES